jgi:hypothetical protein
MDKDFIGKQTYFPAFILNGYLEQELKRAEIIAPNQSFSPFIPVMSSSIDDLYNEYIDTGDGLPIYIAYDTLSRFTPNAFYRHKREQTLYTVHGPLDKIFATIRIINAALDRADSAAQDVNLWASKNQVLIEGELAVTQPIFFHNLKTFQIDESRDLLELQSAQGSTRMIYRNKIIVQYDYHTNDPLDALYT